MPRCSPRFGVVRLASTIITSFFILASARPRFATRVVKCYHSDNKPFQNDRVYYSQRGAQKQRATLKALPGKHSGIIEASFNLKGIEVALYIKNSESNGIYQTNEINRAEGKIRIDLLPRYPFRIYYDHRAHPGGNVESMTSIIQPVDHRQSYHKKY